MQGHADGAAIAPRDRMANLSYAWCTIQQAAEQIMSNPAKRTRAWFDHDANDAAAAVLIQVKTCSDEALIRAVRSHLGESGHVAAYRLDRYGRLQRRELHGSVQSAYVAQILSVRDLNPIPHRSTPYEKATPTLLRSFALGMILRKHAANGMVMR